MKTVVVETSCNATVRERWTFMVPDDWSPSDHPGRDFDWLVASNGTEDVVQVGIGSEEEYLVESIEVVT